MPLLRYSPTQQGVLALVIVVAGLVYACTVILFAIFSLRQPTTASHAPCAPAATWPSGDTTLPTLSLATGMEPPLYTTRTAAATRPAAMCGIYPEQP